MRRMIILMGIFSLFLLSCAASNQRKAMTLCREAYEVYWERDWNSVIELTVRAIKLSPDLPWPYSQRGYAYSQTGQYDLAMDDLSMAIELDPEFSAAYFNRAVLYDILGQKEAAIADFGKAIEHDPYGYAYFRRAIDYIDTGQLNAAETDLRKSIELESNPQYMLTLAELEIRLDNFNEACRLLIRAVENGFNDLVYLEKSDTLAPIRKQNCYFEVIETFHPSD